MERAMGESRNASRFSSQAARKNNTDEMITKFLTNVCDSRPAGNARARVRGLAAAIERHCGGTSGDHRDYDPSYLPETGRPPGSQNRAAQRKWQGKYGMLPLDHFQSCAQIFQQGHKLIVKEKFGVRRKMDSDETWRIPFSSLRSRSAGQNDSPQAF